MMLGIAGVLRIRRRSKQTILDTHEWVTDWDCVSVTCNKCLTVAIHCGSGRTTAHACVGRPIHILRQGYMMFMQLDQYLPVYWDIVTQSKRQTVEVFIKSPRINPSQLLRWTFLCQIGLWSETSRPKLLAWRFSLSSVQIMIPTQRHGIKERFADPILRCAYERHNH